MTTLNTEELLSAALDADPGNHLLRYALADCLDESAGAVECAACGGDEWLMFVHGYPVANRCDRCSGTGRVSDGRRERAEGYRVLAQLGRVPRLRGQEPDRCWVWLKETNVYTHAGETVKLVCGSAGLEVFVLPDEWVAAMTYGPEFAAWMNVGAGWRSYPTRREAEDAAALAWPTLPADVRAAILGAGA